MDVVIDGPDFDSLHSRWMTWAFRPAWCQIVGVDGKRRLDQSYGPMVLAEESK